MRRIRLEDTLRVDSLAKRLWDLTWGLVLVVGLTVVSECGLRMGYSKTPPDASAPVVSQPVGPMVK
jgi:hypothetical protein